VPNARAWADAPGPAGPAGPAGPQGPQGSSGSSTGGGGAPAQKTTAATGLFYALVGSANAKPVALNDGRRAKLKIRNLSPTQTAVVGITAQGGGFVDTPSSYDYTILPGQELQVPGTAGVWAYMPTTADYLLVDREALA
jgi:hypothetical protein